MIHNSTQVFVSERFRFVCVGVPKVASTSLMQTFLDIHGLSAPGGLRSAYRDPKTKQVFAEVGFTETWLPREQLAPLVERHAGYYFFCFVRNPYGRLLSMYGNKLNRYAKAFDRQSYYFGKCRQLLGAWRGQVDAESAILALQRRISLGQFVYGLQEHGVGFDPHFARQSDITSPELIPYNKVGRLESFAADLSEILDNLGVDRTEHAAGASTRKNASDQRAKPTAQLTDPLKATILELYEPDFENFGYAA